MTCRRGSALRVGDLTESAYTVQSARLLGFFRNENYENPRRLNSVQVAAPSSPVVSVPWRRSRLLQKYTKSADHAKSAIRAGSPYGLTASHTPAPFPCLTHFPIRFQRIPHTIHKLQKSDFNFGETSVQRQPAPANPASLRLGGAVTSCTCMRISARTAMVTPSRARAHTRTQWSHLHGHGIRPHPRRDQRPA